MTGIAGIERGRASKEVTSMLKRLRHRGIDGLEVFERGNATFGVVWSAPEEQLVQKMRINGYVTDTSSQGHFARVEMKNGQLTLLRDKIGVVPLYYGKTQNGELCFASEVKALLPISNDINELEPASYFDGSMVKDYGSITVKEPLNWGVEEITMELRDALVDAVEKSISKKSSAGAWLSDGLNSSIIAAIANRYVEDLQTYSIGFEGSGSLKSARRVADYLDSNHHEIVITLHDLVNTIPEVIFHLESFDRILVRRGLLNLLLAKHARKDVDYLFLGDGGNELFGGYTHIKSMTHESIANKLVDLTSKLYNTALLRVDRCTASHGLMPLLPFLSSNVVNLALRIPARYKVYKGKSKWILRETMQDFLPNRILMQERTNNTDDAVGRIITNHADDCISDNELKTERKLPNGWIVSTKEELLYYRTFVEHFGELEDFSWMGHIKINQEVRSYG